MSKKIVYKLNNDNLKEFDVLNDVDTETLFLIKDFTKIPELEVIRLLKKNRKIIISDGAILDVDKLLWIKNQLIKEPHYFNNLLISKETFIKSWFHHEYFDLLKELEIFSNMKSDDIVRSDINLDIGIKVKYFENPDYLLKILDNSLYIKKIVIERFNQFDFNLSQEFDKLISFYHSIKSNLITSISIFIEQNYNDKNLVCNILDNKISGQLLNISSTNFGVVSCLDRSDKIVARMSEYEKSHIFETKINENIGWIDVVKIKSLVKQLNIKTIKLDEIFKYDLLEEIKVCTEYGFNMQRTKSVQSVSECDSMVPLYTRFRGWRQQSSNLENPEDVPFEMLYFISELKKLIDVEEIVVTLNYLEIKL